MFIHSSRRGRAIETIGLALLVPCVLSVLSRCLPASSVPAVFGAFLLLLTWRMVWSAEDASIEAAGLPLGGWMLSAPFSFGGWGRAVGMALAWALLCALVTFPWFWMVWKAWWHLPGPFVSPFSGKGLVGRLIVHALVVALPEEAFYRGYLQSRLDTLLPPRWNVAGALCGLGLPVASLLFALTHLVCTPLLPSLAIFFPSLLFGWLRARTGGIGASVVFHACANLLAELLLLGYAETTVALLTSR